MKKGKKLELKQLLNHLIHNDKREQLKLTEYIQIYKNNDPLFYTEFSKQVRLK